MTSTTLTPLTVWRQTLRPGVMALGLALGMTTLSPTALALDSDANQPINIAADSLSLDDKAGTATYTGRVEMRQGSMKLDAARVDISRADSGEISLVKATGQRAYMEQKPDTDERLVKGWANTIRYHALERRVELVGDARLEKGDDTFEGGYVEYFLDKRQVNASNGTDASSSEGSRVHMTLTPRGANASKDQ
ncbi:MULTISPECIES: lipopolysaccharide transport periplasmic protein LptA [Cobetia]|uniref:Lipopolysaccharide export system protein LptA n=2 Tax=Cobetia TaxID=204286 RepID=A0ABU9GJE6_COBMA|nr:MULTISPECIES: lipopolysaccharide transport periplasmic protein LptA [Cobetia]MDA5563609.1 lipopolysaccharide transport periplasmic protein LptA [Cobetia sp. MMG027]MDH2372632.1 lipopolysaccharide transport periplasmic protein LptA [Cobetia sp. 3AK]MDI6003841.1 lipopolysaccharide transport periplasmic protein LptA [Cobetia pacifica]GED42560.1 lipopolysaccharide export system protein LptA [Cobetia marina]